MEKFRKISKTEARKRYNKGETIYLLPSKVSEEVLNKPTVFLEPYEISNALSDFGDFDGFINQYEYYNCNNNEVGYYAHYYIKENKED